MHHLRKASDRRGWGRRILQEIGHLQVFPNDGVQDHLEDNLDVGGVCCRGEVWVDDFALVQVVFHKLRLDKAGSKINQDQCTGERRAAIGDLSSESYHGIDPLCLGIEL